MKQTKLMSFLETALSTAIGFAVALATQIFVFPLFGFHPQFHENLLITLIFTAVSIARQFVVRRMFEALHIRRPLSPAVQAVIAERFRQKEVEGWDEAHDDAHLPGELAQAGAAYALAMNSVVISKYGTTTPFNGRDIWPWTSDWWKAKDTRRNLVKAAALILAELEKFDRARKTGRGR